MNLFGSLAENWRNANSRVFDGRDTSVQVAADYRFDWGGLYVGGEYRRGDVVSTGPETLANLDLAKVSSPMTRTRTPSCSATGSMPTPSSARSATTCRSDAAARSMCPGRSRSRHPRTASASPGHRTTWTTSSRSFIRRVSE